MQQKWCNMQYIYAAYMLLMLSNATYMLLMLNNATCMLLMLNNVQSICQRHRYSSRYR
uniref:Uncharacterized protein n=1 Tax=Anguilla anguilla TaxID=7936 RepID=A0A0E9WRY8_ANGAN